MISRHRAFCLFQLRVWWALRALRVRLALRGLPVLPGLRVLTVQMVPRVPQELREQKAPPAPQGQTEKLDLLALRDPKAKPEQMGLSVLQGPRERRAV